MAESFYTLISTHLSWTTSIRRELVFLRQVEMATLLHLSFEELSLTAQVSIVLFNSGMELTGPQKLCPQPSSCTSENALQKKEAKFNEWNQISPPRKA